MRSAARALLAITVAILSACDADREANVGEAPGEAAADSQPSAGMSGMEMTSMQSAGMINEMAAHMQLMQGAGADSLAAMLPMHRQMAGELLAQMEREMRVMNMQADPQWTATVDSVRQDLARMPRMNAAELQALMSVHESRITRLMDMHRSMVSHMVH